MFYYRFLQSAERWPNAVAVELQHEGSAAMAGVSPVESYTFADLRQMAESVGRWLLQRGTKRGSPCALLAANHPRWVAAYLGILASGNTAVPLDTAFHAEQVRKLLLDSDSVLLFCDTLHLPVAHEAVAETSAQIVLLDPVPEKALFPSVMDMFAAGPGDFEPVTPEAHEIGAILYTSGTTSDPKGVMLSHANLEAEAESIFAVIDVGPRDVILGILPLFHALAQMANLLLPLAVGMRVVFLESLNTSELLRALQERDITTFCCVPQFFYLIHERINKEVQQRGALTRSLFRAMLWIAAFARKRGLNLGKVFFSRVHKMLGSRMRYLITGGSRFDAAIGRDFEAMGFTLLQAYGLTETSGGASVTSPGHVVMGSVGMPLPGVEFRIAGGAPSAEHGGASVGEIAIRGGIVMEGYYKRPDATAAVLREGWLYTGDLGYCDPHGNYFITGRKKDVIVLSSGKNVYPEEIEAHYAQSPNIKEVCVIGLQSAPGEPYSERLHAVIVPDFDNLRRQKIANVGVTLRFEIEGLSAKLPATKRILSYEIWQEDLPRTTTRKIKRFEVEQRIRRGAGAQPGAGAERKLTAEDAAWLQRPDVNQAVAIIREATKQKKDTLHPADNLELDLGVDSMERVELLASLDQQMGANVPDAVAAELYTVRDLVDAVLGHSGGADARASGGWEEIIAALPSEAERATIDHEHPITAPLWFLTGRILHFVFRDLFEMKVEGLEKLPTQGPFILSPNHQSYLDAPAVISSLPYRIFRKIFYVGTSEIFGGKLMQRIGEKVRLIPIDPDSNLVPAMRAGAYGLRHGRVLVLFPEGERSIDAVPKTFRKGAAILAIHTRCPVVPVAIEGFHEAWPRGERFRRFAKLRVRILDPVEPPEPGPILEEQYSAMTAEIRERVVKAWGELHAAALPKPPIDVPR